MGNSPCTVETVTDSNTLQRYNLLGANCNVSAYPPGFANIQMQITGRDGSDFLWKINLIDSAGNVVQPDVYIEFTVANSNPSIVKRHTISSSTATNRFLDDFGSFVKEIDYSTAYSTNTANVTCVSFAQYYLDSNNRPTLSTYQISIDSVTIYGQYHYYCYWLYVPYSELDSNALSKFNSRNLPPPPTSSTLSMSRLFTTRNFALIPVPAATAPNPNPNARITVNIDLTADETNISKITYTIYDIYRYTTTGNKLVITPNLPTTFTYQSIIVLNNPDFRIFGTELWVSGCTLRAQLDTLLAFSCGDTISPFTEVNLVAYALAKYVLAAIMYGEFNLSYLHQSFNYRFMVDLAQSRFAAFTELFNDPTYGIVGFDSYFKN